MTLWLPPSSNDRKLICYYSLKKKKTPLPSFINLLLLNCDDRYENNKPHWFLSLLDSFSFFLAAWTGAICHFNLQNKSFELWVAVRCHRSLCVLCECHVLSVTFSQGPHSEILSAGEQQMGSLNLKRNRRDIGFGLVMRSGSLRWFISIRFAQVRLIRQRNQNENIWKIKFAAEGPRGPQEVAAVWRFIFQYVFIFGVQLQQVENEGENKCAGWKMNQMQHRGSSRYAIAVTFHGYDGKYSFHLWMLYSFFCFPPFFLVQTAH